GQRRGDRTRARGAGHVVGDLRGDQEIPNGDVVRRERARRIGNDAYGAVVGQAVYGHRRLGHWSAAGRVDHRAADTPEPEHEQIDAHLLAFLLDVGGALCPLPGVAVGGDHAERTDVVLSDEVEAIVAVDVRRHVTGDNFDRQPGDVVEKLFAELD